MTSPTVPPLGRCRPRISRKALLERFSKRSAMSAREKPAGPPSPPGEPPVSVSRRSAGFVACLYLESSQHLDDQPTEERQSSSNSPSPRGHSGGTRMAKISRAISLRQPYVELILRGKKRIEYRSTPTRIRERVYLYAGLHPDDNPEAWDDVRASASDLPMGRIVGTVEIADCQKSKEFRGYYEYRLRGPKRLRRHLKATNQPQPRFWIPQFPKVRKSTARTSRASAGRGKLWR